MASGTTTGSTKSTTLARKDSIREKEKPLDSGSQRRRLWRSQFFNYPERPQDKKEDGFKIDPRINKNFKKRKAASYLKRDCNWNGPRDELFFSFFEQYLD